MNLYFKLMKKPVFTIEDVNLYYNNINSARSAVKRFLEKGMVMKIRNNMYTCVNGESGEAVADRFQIASSITETSYISHHTAMEYYGITDQVVYDVYVSSDTSFREFEFEGYRYRFVKSNGDFGIYTPMYSGGIKITDMERTILDSIKDMDKISGIEETLKNIECVKTINETKLLKYMEEMHNQFLYQKVGNILYKLKKQLGLTDDFFITCKEMMGNSKRYMTRDKFPMRYDKEWHLMVPVDLWIDEVSQKI